MYISPTNLMGRLNSYATKMMFKPIFGAILGSLASTAVGGGLGGQLLGAAVSGLGSSSGARENVRGATERDRLDFERTKPRDVGGLFGGVSWDPETQTPTMELSPEWQAQYDQYLADSARQKGYLGEIEGDPWATADKFYQQKAAMFEPRFEEQRLDEEKRLLAQGRLGGTGGQKQYGTLLDTQADLRAQEQAASYDQAQQMIDTYRKRQTQDLGAAEAVAGLTDKYLDTGMKIGAQMGSAGRLADVASAQQAGTAARTGMMGSFGNIIGSYGQPNKYDEYFQAAKGAGFNPFGGTSNKVATPWTATDQLNFANTTGVSSYL